MVTKELVEYVKSQKAAGKPDSEIKQTLLLGGGWSGADIDEALGPSSHSNTHVVLRILLGTLVVASLLFIVYLGFDIPSKYDAGSFLRAGNLFSGYTGSKGFSYFLGNLQSLFLSFFVISVLANLIFSRKAKIRNVAIAVSVVFLLLKIMPVFMWFGYYIFLVPGFYEPIGAFIVACVLAWLFSSRFSKIALSTGAIITILAGFVFLMDVRTVGKVHFIGRDSTPRIEVSGVSGIFSDAMNKAISLDSFDKAAVMADIRSRAASLNPCTNILTPFIKAECTALFDRNVNDYDYQAQNIFQKISEGQKDIISMTDVKVGGGEEPGICDVRIISFFDDKSRNYFDPCGNLNTMRMDKKISTPSEVAGLFPVTIDFNCPMCTALFGMKAGGERKVVYKSHFYNDANRKLDTYKEMVGNISLIKTITSE